MIIFQRKVGMAEEYVMKLSYMVFATMSQPSLEEMQRPNEIVVVRVRLVSQIARTAVAV